MRSRHSFSATSAPFRCEWRPSRWLAGAMLLLGLLAGTALLNCGLEPGAAWPAALLALCWSTWRAVRGLRRPVRQLWVPPTDMPATIDGAAIDTLQLLERGPLLVVRWRAGRQRGQLLFWPDTLPRAGRRELRLAVRARAVSP